MISAFCIPKSPSCHLVEDALTQTELSSLFCMLITAIVPYAQNPKTRHHKLKWLLLISLAIVNSKNVKAPFTEGSVPPLNDNHLGAYYTSNWNQRKVL